MATPLLDADKTKAQVCFPVSHSGLARSRCSVNVCGLSEWQGQRLAQGQSMSLQENQLSGQEVEIGESGPPGST